MANDRAFVTGVQKLAGTFNVNPMSIFNGKVKSVNGNTCIVTILTGDVEINVPDVMLQNGVCDGLLITPVVGSQVVFITSKNTDAYVIAYSDIDKIELQVGDTSIEVDNDYKIKINKDTLLIENGKATFNNGNNYGLVKVAQLVTEINDMKTILNAFIGVFNAHVHTSTIVGTPTSPTTVPQTTTLTPTNQSTIENTDVKH